MEKRRNEIASLVTREGDISFARLREAFPDVSEMTLRTDLRTLDAEHRLVRVHGGARSVEYVMSDAGILGSRGVRNAERKRAIATKAAALIRPDMSIYLDAGSTPTAMAAAMPDERLIVFTNCVTCVMELARLERPEVIVPGGTLSRERMGLSGSEAIRTISRLSFDCLFLGTSAYSAQTGFTCSTNEEASLKRALIDRAGRTYILMDSSKVDQRSTFSFCELAEVDAVISDGDLPREFTMACAKAKVEVL